MFTLENIFSMDLARYKDACMEIVGNSVKEMSIQRGINEVEKVYFFYSCIFIILFNYDKYSNIKSSDN